MSASDAGGPPTVPIGEPLDGRDPPPDPFPCEDQAELFFSYSVVRRREAKAICAACPHREPCLEYALTLPGITYPGTGVWGGTDYRERVDILRERRLVAREITRGDYTDLSGDL